MSWSFFKKSFENYNIDEKTLLVMTALTLEDELESRPEGGNETQNEKGLNEDELYEALTENVENFTSYIEKLAKKIENY